MKYFFTALLTGLLALPALAQTPFSIRGRVVDKVSGETLPGATVQVTGNGQNTGSGADSDGNYKILGLPAGTYTVQATFVGYKPNTQTVKITTQSVVASFQIASDNASLGEVQVVASQAQERETPVAFSAVNEVKLRETLSNRDLPMILNETPGVYATQGGGGTGDSRITVRGFDQRNVAVMINGVPVNDMENGQVYWSNWDLGDVTKSLQVQRGLSASKIAVPSVGGTINVLTKGFDDKKLVLGRVETGSNNYQKYSLMLSSGPLKGDWAVTVFGSRRSQDGWVENAYDDAWTYFGNISKRVGKHSFSLTGLGSPQRHGTRQFASLVGTYSNDKARELGARNALGSPVAVPNGDRGFAYNPNWGYLTRYTRDDNGQVTMGQRETINSTSNFYHKPQINLNDFWQVTDRLFVSTVAYASHGSGGGIGTTGSLPSPTSDRQVNFQGAYRANYRNRVNPAAAPGTPVDSLSRFEPLSTVFLRSSNNNHRWYGFITGADYLITDKVTLSAGIDGRDYVGEHYQEITDLLGGTYATSTGNRNADSKTPLRVGDKVGARNYDGKVRWLGGYAQAEYKTPVLSAVVSGTLSQINYKRIDYNRARTVTLADGTEKEVPFGTVVNDPATGRIYTNADGKLVETDWVRLPAFSIKAGANYNLTEHHNLFVNAGYNSKVPFFDFVFDFNTGRQFKEVRNEGITSLEVGYGINYSGLKATLNAYYTLWSNKGNNSLASGTNASGDAGTLFTNTRNINARHVGIELGVAQEISRQLQLNAAISLGDWRWVGTGLANTVDDNGEAVGETDRPVYLDGVHVGNAAQNQFQLSLRYEPLRGLYVRPSFLLFSKNYADFDPNTLTDESRRTDSFRVPTSRNLDLHSGYELPNKLFNDHVRLGLRASLLNVLNEFYITDINTRVAASYTDPSQLETFFNRGRTFTVGLSATL